MSSSRVPADVALLPAICRKEARREEEAGRGEGCGGETIPCCLAGV